MAALRRLDVLGVRLRRTRLALVRVRWRAINHLYCDKVLAPTADSCDELGCTMVSIPAAPDVKAPTPKQL